MWSWTQTSGARGSGACSSALLWSAQRRWAPGRSTSPRDLRGSRPTGSTWLSASSHRETNVYRYNAVADRLICGAGDAIVALACDLVPDVQHLGHLWIRCLDQRKEVVQLHKRFGTLEVAGR